MRRPGPIETGSLLVALYLAKTPAGMSVRSLADSAYLVGGVYLLAAVLVAVTPPLLVRRFPGPRRFLRSVLVTLTAPLRQRLRSLAPWARRE